MHISAARFLADTIRRRTAPLLIAMVLSGVPGAVGAVSLLRFDAVQPRSSSATSTKTLDLEAPVFELIEKQRDVAEFRSTATWCTEQAVQLDGRPFTQLGLPMGGRDGKVGEPQLPRLGRFICIPNGAQVSLEIDPFDWVLIEGTFVLAPRQPSPADSADAPSPPFAMDQAVYGANAWRPTTPVRIVDRIQVRGREYLYVVYTPLSYHPRAGALRAAPSVLWRLRFDLPPGGAPAPRPDPVGDEAFAQFHAQAIDATTPDSFASPPKPLGRSSDPLPSGMLGDGPAADYLIIAPDAFVETLRPFAMMKQAQGLETRIVPLSLIGEAPTAGQIKSFIQGAYETWSPAPTYLLLVGDVPEMPTHTSGEFLETVGMWSLATDLPYAQMDDDLFADLISGRWPVGNVAECADVVAKQLAHQQSPETNATFRSTVLSVGYFQDTSCVPPDYPEPEPDGIEERLFIETAEAFKNYYSSVGQNVVAVYEREGDVEPRRYNPESQLHAGESLYNGAQSFVTTSTNGQNLVREALEAGAWLVQYRGHGMIWGWWNEDQFLDPTPDSVNNRNSMPIILSVTCQTGMFDQPRWDAFAEDWLECNLATQKGAAAVVAATRNSLSWHNDWFVHGFNESMSPGYLRALSSIPGYLPDLHLPSPGAARSSRIGSAVEFAKRTMYERFGGPDDPETLWQFQVLTLFGDPHMPVRPWESAFLQVSLPQHVFADQATFTVAVASNGTPLAGAQVNVTSLAGDHASGISGGDGTIAFDFVPAAITGNLHVVVSASGGAGWVGAIPLVKRSLVIAGPPILEEGEMTPPVQVLRQHAMTPVEGARVTLANWHEHAQADTGADGHAHLNHRLRGGDTIRLAAVHERFHATHLDLSVNKGSFVWSALPTNLVPGASYPATVELRSPTTSTLVGTFTGDVALEAYDQVSPPAVVLTEIAIVSDVIPAHFTALRFQNTTSEEIDLAGWRIAFSTSTNDIAASYDHILHPPGILDAGASIPLRAFASATYPLPALTNLHAAIKGWVALVDDGGQVADFFAWGWLQHEIEAMRPLVDGTPLAIGSQWNGHGYSRWGWWMNPFTRVAPGDTNTRGDWEDGSAHKHPDGIMPLPMQPDYVRIDAEPVQASFTNGVWTGFVRVLEACESGTFRATFEGRQGGSDVFSADAPVIDHFAFGEIATPRLWDSPFVVTTRVCNAHGVAVADYQASPRLYAFTPAPASPVLITELSIRDGAEKFIELHNVSGAPANTAGWRLLLGDQPDAIHAYNAVVKELPASFANDEIVFWSDEPSRGSLYWGAPMGWTSEDAGWAMLVDDQHRIADFVAWGWPHAAITNMAVALGAHPLRPGDAQWTGPGAPVGGKASRGTLQRTGSVDYNRMQDFAWRQQRSPGEPNHDLARPLTQARRPLNMLPPVIGPFGSGIWAGAVTVREATTDVRLAVVDGTGITGESNPFEVRKLGNLSLSFPAVVREGDGSVVATVTASPAPPTGLLVGVFSSDTTELVVPGSVAITPGQSSAVFNVTVVDDPDLDFAQSVNLVASAAGYGPALRKVAVLDNESAGMELHLPAQVAEGDGLLPLAGQLVLVAPLAQDTRFALTSSHPAKLEVPATIVISNGQNRISFDLFVPGNTTADGSATVFITASPDEGLTSATGSVSVLDDDPARFVFDPIASPQTAKNPFGLSVYALDGQGHPVAGFTRSVSLSALSGLDPVELSQASIGPFIAGVWTGTLAVMHPATNVQLFAAEGDAEGKSPVFNVAHGPFAALHWEVDGLDPVHAGAWLPVTLSARDAHGFVVGNFAGPVPLDATRHSPHDPVRILSFIKYSHVDGAHADAVAAIRRHFPHIAVYTTDTTDPAQLEGELLDVLLIPAQTDAPEGAMRHLGRDWSGLLKTYVQNGGLLAVCTSRTGEEHELPRDAQLAEISRVPLGEPEYNDFAMLEPRDSHDLAVGLPQSFVGWHLRGYRADKCTPVARTQSYGVPVAIERSLGAGRILVLGTDLAAENQEHFGRILANAVRAKLVRVPLAAPIVPGATGSFTNGMWSGILQVPAEGQLVRLRATANATGYESEEFDIAPLAFSGIEQGSGNIVRLRWNSMGVTPYTILLSTNLFTSERVPVATNLPATPPANVHEIHLGEPGHGYYILAVPQP